MPASLSVVANHFSFVRETLGPNRGYWVNLFQRFTHGNLNDSWCCDFVSYVEDIAYMGKSPSVITGICQVKLDDAKKKGYVTVNPSVDDLCFSMTNDHAHHVGIIVSINPLITIAGNTSEDGLSSNGTGVFTHQVSPSDKVYVHLPR